MREADDREFALTRNLKDVDSTLETLVNNAIESAWKLGIDRGWKGYQVAWHVFDELGRDEPGSGLKYPIIGEKAPIAKVGVKLEKLLNRDKDEIKYIPFGKSRYHENLIYVARADGSAETGVPWLFSPTSAQHGLAPTIRVRGVLMGVDKWEHFFQQGFWLYRLSDIMTLKVEVEVRQTIDRPWYRGGEKMYIQRIEGRAFLDAGAQRQAFNLFMEEGGFMFPNTTRQMPKIKYTPPDRIRENGQVAKIKTRFPDAHLLMAKYLAHDGKFEPGYFGAYSTGVISYADIAANNAGNEFYKALAEAFDNRPAGEAGKQVGYTFSLKNMAIKTLQAFNESKHNPNRFVKGILVDDKAGNGPAFDKPPPK